MTESGRHALIIAVSEYDDPKLRQLRAPTADAERLARVLRDPEIGGFDVDVALDADEPSLSRRLARFFRDRRPDDLLFLHFSCHGVKDENGELHLATTDTEMDLLGATSISSTWLNAQIGRSRSKRIVVLLDCCFSGSFPFGVRARAGAEVDVRGALDGRGRAVITASSAMEYAFEGDRLSGEGQPSVFTSAVVDALASGRADRDQDGRISIDELYDYVFAQVRERTPSQSPQIMSSLEGPLYIARSTCVAPVAVAVTRDALGGAEQPPAPARLAQPAPAEWSVRSRAAGLDVLLAGLIGFYPAIGLSSSNGVVSGNALLLFIAISLLIGGIVYSCLFLGSHPGRTLGKRTYELTVATVDGIAATRGRVMGRELLKWAMFAVIGATLGLLIGVLAIYVQWREDGRPPHDVLAGTTVMAIDPVAVR